MRQLRTDLAMESLRGPEGGFPGVHVSHWETMGVSLTEVIVETEEAARSLGKATGVYMTLECPAIRQRDLDARTGHGQPARRGDSPACWPARATRRRWWWGWATAASRRTPSARRPSTARWSRATCSRNCRTLPTSACAASAPSPRACWASPAWRPWRWSRPSPPRCGPRAILCVDSLAARAAARIGAAIQLTDAGIQPGSGVGNHRRSLTREALGVPVIAVGMPTVIYAATLARDAMEALTPDISEEALWISVERGAARRRAWGDGGHAARDRRPHRRRGGRSSPPPSTAPSSPTSVEEEIAAMMD